jgi:putative regulator of septum formation
VVAAFLLAPLALAGCSSSDDPPAKGERFGPDTPVVGACRVLTAQDIKPSSNNTPTVSCNSAHTAVTISVGGFPPSQVTNARLRSGALGNEALQRCRAAWRKTVGGTVETQHLTVLGLTFYLPDPDQLSRGSRWYRCDLILGGEDGMGLKDLPRHVEGLLVGTVPDSLLACRTAPTFKEGNEVACSSPHVLRAVGVAPLPDKPTYPGTEALKAASAKGCQTVVKQWLKGRFSSGTAYQWPDKLSWDVLRDRSATCWAVTTD